MTGGRQLKKIGYEAFQYCRKLESITLSSTIKEFSSYIFDECDRLKTAGPSSGDYNIKIGFTGNIPDTPLSNSEVESVVLPEGLTELNVYAIIGMIPDFNTSTEHKNEKTGYANLFAID